MKSVSGSKSPYRMTQGVGSQSKGSSRLTRNYSDRLYTSLYVDGMLRRQRRQESVEQSLRQKEDKELDGCTFTPDIGRKGIVYETIKAERDKS